MQIGASFNLEAVKAQIEEHMAGRIGQWADKSSVPGTDARGRNLD
jgi:hypothetical protein